MVELGKLNELLLQYIEIYVHLLLRVRGIYPANSFEAMNFNGQLVYRCKHRGVNEYIEGFIRKIQPLLSNGVLEVIYLTLSTQDIPLNQSQDSLTTAMKIEEQYAIRIEPDKRLIELRRQWDVESLLKYVHTKQDEQEVRLRLSQAIPKIISIASLLGPIPAEIDAGFHLSVQVTRQDEQELFKDLDMTIDANPFEAYKHAWIADDASSSVLQRSHHIHTAEHGVLSWHVLVKA